MKEKISELTVDEMKSLISESVRETMEDVIEDFVALNSPEYLKSIAEAREDYKQGRVKTLEQLFGA